MTAPTASSGSKSRRWLVQGVLLALAFGLLAWTIWGNRDQIQQVIASKPDLRKLGLAFVLYILGMFVTFVRWHQLVRALGLPFRLADAFRLGLIGTVFNLVIPGGVGGDLIKAAFLCREQAKKTQAVASMVIDRGVGLLGLFLLAGVAGLFELQHAVPEVRGLIGLAWLAVLAGLIGLAVLFTPALYRPLLKLLAGKGRLEAIAQEFVELASLYRERLGVVGLALALSVLGHSLFVLAFTVVDHALFPETAPSLARHLVITPLVLFTTAVPLPMGALGLTEKASEAVFKLVNFPGGAVAMMGYRVIMYLGGLLCALVYMANASQVRSLRQNAEEIEAEVEHGDLRA